MNRLVRLRRHAVLAGLAALLLSSGSALAASAQVAVAANFTDAAQEIAAAFQAETGDEAVLSFGSTGQIYAQIAQGAPFEVFLAADDVRPERVANEGLGVEGSVFTYAIGQLVLYSADPALVKDGETLKDRGFRKIAIANPETAPYGAAAVETMKALGLYDALSPRLVQGTSIAQTHQFVETGSAELGFVALGQVVNAEGGSQWVVPPSLYTPIRQDAVLLTRGEGNETAKAFVAFLKGPKALEIIRRYGYRTAE